MFRKPVWLRARPTRIPVTEADRSTRNRTLKPLIAALASLGVVFGAGIAFGAIPDSAGVIHGCIVNAPSAPLRPLTGRLTSPARRRARVGWPPSTGRR